MSLIIRRPILLAVAVALVLSIQLVPQSTFYGDDYIQLGKPAASATLSSPSVPDRG